MNHPGNIDIDGMATLEMIRTVDNFNRWMYDTLRIHCSGKILEVGSGIGNISKYFLDDGYDITLSDNNPSYCEILKNLSQQYGNRSEIIPINIVDEMFDKTYAQYFGKYSCILMVNVLEHIHDERMALLNCLKLLGEGGTIVVLVPAFQSLYSTFDTTLGHFRRYTRRELESALMKCRYTIESSQYFNMAGIVGWFIFGKVLRKQLIPDSQMTLYNSMVGIFKFFDRIILHRCGLSIIAVGKKNAGNGDGL
jgi:SAM-dependent methyltransferase